jgi:hypothetical protein
MIDAEPPNFTDWSTSRLKFLLVEYSESIPAIRTLYGSKHPETLTYVAWVKAIEAELNKREENAKH